MYEALTPNLLEKIIKELEEKMYQYTRDLDFEAAARLRDEIRLIQDQGLGLAGIKTA